MNDSPNPSHRIPRSRLARNVVLLAALAAACGDESSTPVPSAAAPTVSTARIDRAATELGLSDAEAAQHRAALRRLLGTEAPMPVALPEPTPPSPSVPPELAGEEGVR